MPVEIDRGSLLKIARTKGEKGEPLPDWADGDTELTNAYYGGAGVEPVTPAPKSPAPKKRPTAPTKGTTSSQPSPAGSPARVSSARRAPARQSAPSSSWKQRAANRLTPGSAGGVLLAVFIYPCVLAGLEAGPAGVVQWLKAKFLNDGATTAAPNVATPSHPIGGSHGPGHPTILAPDQSPVRNALNGVSGTTKGPTA